AYYLARADPQLRIAVLDRHHVGFGASGRNGGWCSGLLANSLTTLAERHGRAATIAMQAVMHDSVDEVGRVLAAEGIDADFAKGGTITAARTPEQHGRLIKELLEARSFGLTTDDVRWLEPDEVQLRCAMSATRAALFTPHCAALHPLRLVHGLARATQRRGVAIHGATPVLEQTAAGLVTPHGRVRADAVVWATEAWTATRPDTRRAVVPLYSLMIGTAPLTEEQWAAIGLAERETFHDARHLIIYGQRTTDGRLAFGGRGAPYHFASRIAERFDRSDGVRDLLADALRELFPVLADVDVPFHWGGPLAVPRDWQWSVGFDRSTGTGHAGGYVGDGVSTTNVAGRTLADLINGASTSLTELPWVDHRSRRWEPEPLRWLGINLTRHAATRADHAERGDGPQAARRARRWSRVLSRLTGR
ncbi:MAG: NAD(P)/FAD-dependent oxidoreductase, partial [Ilumatobacteraceae bacterium]